MKTNFKTKILFNKKGEKTQFWKFLPVGIFIFIFAYVIVLQIPAKDFQLSAFLGGNPSLSFHENTLKITTINIIKSLEFHFLDEMPDVDDCKIYYDNEDEKKEISNKQYMFKPNPDDNLLQVIMSESILGEMTFEFTLAERYLGKDPKRYHIKKVVVNGSEKSLYDFIENEIKSEESNIYLYTPFTIDNISGYLALKFGIYLLFIIQLILICLALFQLLSLTLSLRYGWIQIIRLEFTFIDTISKDYSLQFGFLGTIVSLWVSLETSVIGAGDLYLIIEILKKAVFTTVLGTMTYAFTSIKMSLLHKEDHV
jgi:hypothetical protein